MNQGQNQAISRIRAVLAGYGVTLPNVAWTEVENAIDAHSDDRLAAYLTERQREVMDHLATGQLDKEIAEMMGLSIETVKEHKTAAYKRLNVRNRSEALILWLRLKGG